MADSETALVLLGTGNPNPDPDCMGPALAIVAGGRVYLVDAGPGVIRRAALAGIPMTHLTRAFITHLHSDHTAGLPDLFLTPAVVGRAEPLELYGPRGLRAMTRHLLAAYKQDITIRTRGLEHGNPAGYTVNAHEVTRGEIYRDDAVRVVAFRVQHGAWQHAYGYRFETADKTIVVSGDTTYSRTLIAAARGCDILVHEVYCEKGWAKRTPDWQAYHAAYHTSAPQLGQLATKVGAKKLVLVHQLTMGEPPAQIVEEISAHYSGEIIYGQDLDLIT
ncbi:MAG TPA: MBL fold metallo-hydrolase [Opitutus sp.]|nr:MBL fold metallo-hydrolase [Opitutus sp.]